MALRVLHASKFYPPYNGGMETILGDLCDGTAGDWDVNVVVANEGPRTVRERRNGVAVTRAASHGTAASVPLCPSLPSQLWRQRADCVILHEPNPIAGTALWLRTPAPRFVVWHHSDLVRPFWAPATYGRIQRALYRRADCVIVSSPALARDSALVQSARRVCVIPFGVDVDRYRRADAERMERVTRIRARFASGPLLLFVGRLVYYKGVHVLIEAANQWPGPVALVGDGPLESELRADAVRRGLVDRVVFLGRVSNDDLPAYYQACDAFVLPSVARTEAFGVVQIEAMAAGKPVVSTNLPTGVPWVNRDGVSGMVVAPENADALGAALAALGNDPALRSRLGAGARSRAESLFTRGRMVQSFKTLIETVVQSPARLAELPRPADVERVDFAS
ncbi:MAG TPA: glycosyltransferase [Vicinamibacterales bacterium]|nr:glycosyltransferase [Vicinamibacterales bacterium]